MYHFCVPLLPLSDKRHGGSRLEFLVNVFRTRNVYLSPVTPYRSRVLATGGFNSKFWVSTVKYKYNSNLVQLLTVEKSFKHTRVYLATVMCMYMLDGNIIYCRTYTAGVIYILVIHTLVKK